MFVEEILGRNVVCVISVMLLSRQGRVKPCLVEELVKSFWGYDSLKRRINA